MNSHHEISIIYKGNMIGPIADQSLASVKLAIEKIGGVVYLHGTSCWHISKCPKNSKEVFEYLASIINTADSLIVEERTNKYINPPISQTK